MNFTLWIKRYSLKIWYLSIPFVLMLLIASCANQSHTRIGLFSATSSVIGIVNETLFVGEATGYLDRTGVINLQSVSAPIANCSGNFIYIRSREGVAKVSCDDGSQADFEFVGLSALSGYGKGSTSAGTATFTFGLSADDATPYLYLPDGKSLIEGQDGAPSLIDSQASP